MSEAMPIVPKSWRRESGEEVLREEPVLTAQRDRAERDNPRQRLFNALVFGGLGALIAYPSFMSAAAGDFGWRQPFAFIWLLVFAYFAFQTSRKTEPTRWASIHRYVFTNHRAAVLNESGALLDEVRCEDINDVVLDKKLVVIWRVPNTSEYDSFNIAYIERPDELFEFVRETYT